MGYDTFVRKSTEEQRIKGYHADDFQAPKQATISRVSHPSRLAGYTVAFIVVGGLGVGLAGALILCTGRIAAIKQHLPFMEGLNVVGEKTALILIYAGGGAIVGGLIAQVIRSVVNSRTPIKTEKEENALLRCLKTHEWIVYRRVEQNKSLIAVARCMKEKDKTTINVDYFNAATKNLVDSVYTEDLDNGQWVHATRHTGTLKDKLDSIKQAAKASHPTATKKPVALVMKRV